MCIQPEGALPPPERYGAAGSSSGGGGSWPHTGRAGFPLETKIDLGVSGKNLNKSPGRHQKADLSHAERQKREAEVMDDLLSVERDESARLDGTGARYVG
jgi:hypothetical protein